MNEKKQKTTNKYKKNLQKDKGAMFFVPNPKTCTQYKERKNQLTNKSKE